MATEISNTTYMSLSENSVPNPMVCHDSHYFMASEGQSPIRHPYKLAFTWVRNVCVYIFCKGIQGGSSGLPASLDVRDPVPKEWEDIPPVGLLKLPILEWFVKYVKMWYFTLNVRSEWFSGFTLVSQEGLLVAGD
jgi:hypothetical protein